MKYIRTKEGIYEVEKLNLNKIVGNIKYEIIDNKLFKTMYGYESHLYESEIIKQADTIEELCDEIVIKDNLLNENPILIMKEKINSFNDVHCITIYGAIWIEIKLQNGKSVYKLEPVAILNEDGELELI